MSDERPNNNPYQEQPGDELSYHDALRTIAERTAFRSELERDQVYAALAKEHSESADDAADDSEVGGSTGDSPATVNGPGSGTTPTRTGTTKRR